MVALIHESQKNTNLKLQLQVDSPAYFVSTVVDRDNWQQVCDKF